MTKTADVVSYFAADQLFVRVQLLVGTTIVAQQAGLIGLLKWSASQESRVQVRREVIALALHERVVAGRAYQLSLADRAAEVVRQRYGRGITDSEIARVAA